jgi:hypothetical protein
MHGLGEKTTLELNERRRFEQGLKPSVHEVYFARERWATLANDALREAHIDARIDHRTLQAQGIDREPLPHIPQGAFETERRGGYSAIAARIREDYQARVLEREERAASARYAEAKVASPPARDASMPPAAFRPQSLDDIRREARESWLRMRAQGGGVAVGPDRTNDRERQPNRDRDREPERHADRDRGRDRNRNRDRDRDQDLGR